MFLAQHTFSLVFYFFVRIPLSMVELSEKSLSIWTIFDVEKREKNVEKWANRLNWANDDSMREKNKCKRIIEVSLYSSFLFTALTWNLLHLTSIYSLRGEIRSQPFSTELLFVELKFERTKYEQSPGREIDGAWTSQHCYAQAYFSLFSLYFSLRKLIFVHELIRFDNRRRCLWLREWACRFHFTEIKIFYQRYAILRMRENACDVSLSQRMLKRWLAE